MRARDVGTVAVSRYIKARRDAERKNATINRELSLLRRGFNLGFAAEPRLVAAVPRIPKLAENNVRKGFFDHDQFLLIRAELPEYLIPPCYVCVFHGLPEGRDFELAVDDRWISALT